MDEQDRVQEIQERHAIEREHRRQLREQQERETREAEERKAEASREAAREEIRQKTLARHQREREERARLRAEQERDQKEQRAKKEREVLERHRGERETRVALRHDQTVAHLRSRRESEAYREKHLPAIREQWRVSPWEPRKPHYGVGGSISGKLQRGTARIGTAMDRGLAVLDPFADTAYKAHDYLFKPRVQRVQKLNRRTGQFDTSFQLAPSRYGSFRMGVLGGMDTFERGRKRETRAYRSQARMMRSQFASPTQFMYSLMGRKPRRRGYIREPWDDGYKPRKRRMSSRPVRDPWEFGFGF